MPTLMFLLGLIAWVIPTLAGVWYLLTFRDMRNELRMIRRYLQAVHDRLEQRR